MGTRLVTLAAAFALVGVPGASAAGVFSDPTGDQVDKADLIGADITIVEVDHTQSVVGLRVTIGNYATLPPRSRIAILFDLDRNIATGDQGFENAVKYDVDSAGASRFTFERFEESRFSLVEVPDSNATGSFSAGAFTAIVPRSELQNPTELEFGLYAVRFGADERDVAGDVAPNANLWYYSFAEPAPLRLAVSKLVLSPRRPLAGKPFSISSVVTRSDTGMTVRTGSVTCNARLGNAPLRARGGFRARNARCTMAIPRTAKGKRLTGSMTVRAHGAAVTKRFSFRVA